MSHSLGCSLVTLSSRTPCFTNDIKDRGTCFDGSPPPPTHFKVTFISFLVEIDFLFLFFYNLFSPTRDEASLSECETQKVNLKSLFLIGYIQIIHPKINPITIQDIFGAARKTNPQTHFGVPADPSNRYDYTILYDKQPEK